MGLENIRFLDYVDEADLPALYSGAAMFILPSVYEGFGLPLAEAMACGSPVIAARAAAMPEVIGDAGILVDPDSVGELAAAMVRLATDRALADRCRSKGLERARLFSWPSGTMQLLGIYEGLRRNSRR